MHVIYFVQCTAQRVCLCRVNHSKNAIVKPQGPTPQEEKREVEEAMKRIKEANKAIAKVIETPTPPGEQYKLVLAYVRRVLYCM